MILERCTGRLEVGQVALLLLLLVGSLIALSVLLFVEDLVDFLLLLLLLGVGERLGYSLTNHADIALTSDNSCCLLSAWF